MSQQLPDLVLDKDAAEASLLFTSEFFSNSSCAVYENCITGTGKRTLIRFSTLVVNQGQASLFPPLPKEAPNLFRWSPCHGHYHFEQFAFYWLLDKKGIIAVTGRKMGYCMEDSFPIFDGPLVPCEPQSDCNGQGLSVGWGDIYGFDLDCQWLDITGIPSGTYTLKITVNPQRFFQESTYDNNDMEFKIVIPNGNVSIFVPLLFLLLLSTIISLL